MVDVAALRFVGLKLALTALLLATAQAAPLQQIDGTVTRVSDGDTLWLRPDDRARKPFRLRLVGLDAPEICQAHGAAARAALESWVLGRRVSLRRHAVDDHGRPLGTLWLDGHDVGARLVAAGHAWSARFRGDPGPYAAEEAAARAARRGLFAARDPELPRDFRRRHGPCR
jgi:micrococcal nuclease